MKKSHNRIELTGLQREALLLDATVRRVTVNELPLLHAIAYPNQKKQLEVVSAWPDSDIQANVRNATALLRNGVNRLVLNGKMRPAVVQQKISGSAAEIVMGACYGDEIQVGYTSVEVPTSGKNLFTGGTRPWVRNILFGEVDHGLSVVRSRFITLFGQGERFDVEHTVHTTSIAEAQTTQEAIDRIAANQKGPDHDSALSAIEDYKVRTAEAMRFASMTGLSAICEFDIAEIRQRVEETFGAQAN